MVMGVGEDGSGVINKRFWIAESLERSKHVPTLNSFIPKMVFLDTSTPTEVWNCNGVKLKDIDGSQQWQQES